MSVEFLTRVMGLPNERSVEIPWLLDNCRVFPALDVGCAESVYITELGGSVDGIDLRETSPHLGFRQTYVGDIRTWTAPEKYPTVLAISTVEHIGLQVQAYGTERDAPFGGDRKAIEGCMANLADDGVMLLTVPFGEQFADCGWYRTYDQRTLNTLLRGYDYNLHVVMDPAWEVGGVALVKVRHR